LPSAIDVCSAQEKDAMTDDGQRPDLSTLPTEVPRVRRPRGFAAMPREQVSAIARLGGRAAHVAGTAHEWDHEEASVAGRKGGLATTARKQRERQAASDPVDHE
jgi:general stress protein YciG